MRSNPPTSRKVKQQAFDHPAQAGKKGCLLRFVRRVHQARISEGTKAVTEHHISAIQKFFFIRRLDFIWSSPENKKRDLFILRRQSFGYICYASCTYKERRVFL